MLRPLLALALAILAFASAATTVPGCSIRSLVDGVHPPDAGAPQGDSGADGAVPPCAADLAHDQANCGRCGRACAGPCDDGTCDVTTIADGQPEVAALATDGVLIVWSAGKRTLRACPVEGKTAPSVIVPEVDLSGQFVIDGESVFYTTGVTSSHSVEKCTLPECKDDTSLGFDLGTPTALAADQGDVFVLEPEGRRVLGCGGAGGCSKDIAKNTSADGAIALGLSNVYWSVLDTPGAIYSCPRSGCDGQTPLVFAPSVTTPRALAVDLNDVWWTSYNGGTVASCPVTGCAGTPKLLASAQKNPLGIATDGTRVYWANAGAGTVVTCESAGCADTPRVVVRGLDRPQWVALDATHVYFATAGGVIGRTLK